MEFSSADFKRLQYDVYNLPETEQVLEKWPDLKRFPEFTSKKLVGISRDKVLRYIFLAYDKRSPLLSEKNLSKRKRLAADFAGFERNDKEIYDDSVVSVMKNENNAVVRMIIRFVRMQSDMRFSLLVAGMETYYENIVKITNNDKEDGVIDSADKSKLFEQSKKMSDELERISDEIYNGDIQLMHESDTINEEEKEIILSYPEFIAKQKEKKVEQPG